MTGILVQGEKPTCTALHLHHRDVNVVAEDNHVRMSWQVNGQANAGTTEIATNHQTQGYTKRYS